MVEAGTAPAQVDAACGQAQACLQLGALLSWACVQAAAQVARILAVPCGKVAAKVQAHVAAARLQAVALAVAWIGSGDGVSQARQGRWRGNNRVGSGLGCDVVMGMWP